MKALHLLVKKIWPRLKFFKSRANFKVKVTRSKLLVPLESPGHKECTCMGNIKALPPLVKKIWPRLKVFLLGQTSRSRSLGKKVWYPCKARVTRNVHVKYMYKSPTSSG